MATSGPENSSKRNVFSTRRKLVSDHAARMADGRLFHARGVATENDQRWWWWGVMANATNDDNIPSLHWLVG